MMRSQRKATPLFALFAFELAALAGLHILGRSPSMQVPWHELSPWLQQGSVEEIVAPLVRLAALVVAYWMFISTTLFTLAQLSRIPAAIAATSIFTMPSVRRVVDGAVAVSLATSSLVGLGGTAAMAATPADHAQHELTLTTADLAVVDSPSNQPAGTTTTSSAPTTTSSTSTTSSTTQAPKNLPVAPGAGDDYVSSPRANPLKNTQASPATTKAPKPATPAPRATKPAAPAGPSAPAAPGTEVKGVQEHKVVKGDNLWTIARDALASSTNRSAKDMSESEVREYWLKVIDQNRDHLRSGDPHWIFPGEVITLP